MSDILPETYCAYAESRLREAGERCQKAIAAEYTSNLGELAKVASLTWDGAIDILSALATLDGEHITGRSSDLHQYARNNLPPDDMAHWRHLARLHNFQHKPNHPEPVFRQSCHYTGIFLELLNNRLMPALRLPADCWEWLTAL